MTTSIASRIEWCRGLKTQACTPLEREGWHAEEEGLRDALLHRDHTTQYQQGPLCVYGRYVVGLQDGEALIRAVAMEQQFATPDGTW
jgi:hypothetical protein